MVDIQITELAKLIGDISYENLIDQLRRAGIEVSLDQNSVTEKDKKKILAILKEYDTSTAHKKISLQRKSVSTIKVKRASGQKSTVSVIRKKRQIYVKREEQEASIELENKEKTNTPIEIQANDQETLKNSAIQSKQINVNADEEKILKPFEEKFNKNLSTEISSDVEKKPDAESKKKKKSKCKESYKDDKDRRSRRKIKEKIIEPKGENFFRRIKKKKKETEDLNPHAFEKPKEPAIKEVDIPESIVVADLAKRISIKTSEVIKTLMKLGVMATINQPLDQDTAALLVEEMGHKVRLIQEDAIEHDIFIEYLGNPSPRSAVITVMGHVDHGKTTLLDCIRKTRVASEEAGGITQHIGAYQARTKHGMMTFIDTPGHSAFTAMRARGAKSTDAIILVVGADDGVMPQTKEAIQHAKAADVPIIVAINKIDKLDADPDRVTNELSKFDLIPESWGGDTIYCYISAKEGTGIDKLLESVYLQTELLELKANVVGAAQGVVLEARLDKGRGPVATLCVQQGTLNKGDVVLAGTVYGKIRSMFNDIHEEVQTAGPSMPVEVLGLSGTANAGDNFAVVDEEKKAREVAIYRHSKKKETKLARQRASQLSGFMERMQQQEIKTLNLLIKADVQGSIEVLTDTLEKLSNDELTVHVVSSGVGGFNESDVNLAIASEAIMIGFNVRADSTARRLAQQEGITFQYYSVIYDVVDGIKRVVSGKIRPKYEDKVIGLAEVRNVFKSFKMGAVAGCMVVEGVIKRGYPIRVLRHNVVIYEGELESLRRFKESVAEVRNNMECGIAVKNYNDVKQDDQIEVFERIKVAQTYQKINSDKKS